jgi:cytochrome c biogenesis protein CcdA
MKGLTALSQWIHQVFEAPEFGALILPAALLLGIVTAVGSGCNLALLAGVAGYAGTRQDRRRRDVVSACVFFALGTVVSLGLLGMLVAYLGQVAGSKLGVYGRAFTGIVMVLLGLAALNLVPFRLPRFASKSDARPAGLLGAAVFGLAAGSGSVACTMACSGPLLPLVLGLAAMRGDFVWGSLIAVMFAVGYSLPLVVAMMGVSLGRLSRAAGKMTKHLRLVAGILLVGVGFWMLATL